MKTRKSLLLNSGQNGNRWVTTLKAVLSSLGKCLVVAGPELGRMLCEFDLIILDTRRTVDLRSTISNLRLQNPHASVVVCSSVPNWKESREALLAGATDYFGKSLDQHLLLARLKETLQVPHWRPNARGKNDREEAEIAVESRVLKTDELKNGKEQHMIGNRTILLVDNREEAIEIYIKIFENRGYRVLGATTLKRAAELLGNENIHLGVFDVDMHDHSHTGRTGDQSGLLFAQDPQYRALTKIILTEYPSIAGARESLRVSRGTTSDKDSFAGVALSQTAAAVDYRSKADGADKLVEAVQDAFERHVRINWELEITINNDRPISFNLLAELIEPGLVEQKLLNRAEELKDLFRRLCYEANGIRIERLLWQREGRVALLVSVIEDGEESEPIVVVCGQSERIAQERLDYSEFGPKRQTATVPRSFEETLHYGANAYSLRDADLEELNSFDELYRFDSEKIRDVVNDLFPRTLVDWFPEKPLVTSTSYQELYRKRFGLSVEYISQESFRERLQALVAAIAASGEKMELSGGTLTIEFDHDKVSSFPDPTEIIYEISDPEPLQLIRTPGTLSAANIITDANGRTWLTDFGDAGLAPQIWNHVAFEAVVRFDLTNPHTLPDIFKLEHQLVERNFNLVAFKVGKHFSKALDSIKTIRLLATNMVGDDTLSYHLGILYQAANRLTAFNPETKLPRKSLMRLAQPLVAAAMICGRISKTKTGLDSFHRPGINISNDRVWIDNDPIDIAGKNLRLITCLLNHVGQNVKYEDLLTEAFGIVRPGVTNINNLQVAIKRLRDLIEPDPDKPRYILNENRSYRLVPKV